MNFSHFHKHLADIKHTSAAQVDAAKWNPGVFIDIDGVVLTGGKPYEWSREAIHVS